MYVCTCVCVCARVCVCVCMICLTLSHFLQNLETALAGGMGQMSLVNDYQMFRSNLGSSSVVVAVTYLVVSSQDFTR